MRTAYQEMDETDQVEILRLVALEAAAQFDLEVLDAQLVLHDFNTTFQLRTPQGLVAMRVNTNSMSTPDNIAAQQSWQHALRQETGVLVPDPIPVRGGGYLARVPSAELGREVLITASSWLAGDDLGAVATKGHARALGALAAELHTHAERWTVPEPGRFPVFDSPLFGDPDLLTGAVADDPELAAIVAEATARCSEAFAQVRDIPAIPLHADLHGGNLKWHDGRLAAFDFDDSGLGVPALDLAIATFYLRGEDPGLERAMREGYAEVRPLPEIGPADAEALVAGRQLLLANSLLLSTTAGHSGDALAYLTTTGARLRHWLDTGHFTRALPGR